MSHHRIDNGSSGGASITIAPYEYPLVWEFVGKGRYLQAAFCKTTAQLYSAKFDTVTAKNLSNMAAKGAFLGLLEWSKDIGCCWDESVFESGASGGSVEVLGWLIDNGCPFRKDSSTCTAAARGGNLDALTFLLIRGCCADKNTFTAAAENGRLNVLQYAHKYRCDWDSKHVCRIVAEHGQIHILQWMHETLHVDGLLNEELCEISACAGRIEVLQWLRSVGCPWNANTCWVAIRKGHLHVIEWAIDEGCPWSIDDVNPTYGETGLLVAARCGHAKVLEFFINRGASINAVEDWGCTSLSSAVWEEKVDCVRVLVAAGADVNIADSDGFTPLDVAINKGHHEIEAILRAAGATE